MPSFRHDGATIYYEEFGQGFTILTFAPAPIDPITEFASSFRVIAPCWPNPSGAWEPYAFVSTCATPCLILAGNDEAHPLPRSPRNWPSYSRTANILRSGSPARPWPRRAPA